MEVALAWGMLPDEIRELEPQTYAEMLAFLDLRGKRAEAEAIKHRNIQGARSALGRRKSALSGRRR